MSDEISTPSSFTVGATLIKKYEILEELPQGGMGGVVKARRLTDGKIVAIKWCRLIGDDWHRRFEREVRITKQITHPNVVPILAHNFKHRPPYFVMPFADGSIGSQLSVYAADEPRALIDILAFCAGVQAIHNAGAVHRDIKPDNGLLFDGKVVVADLGLAKLCERDTTILTQTVAIVGTQMYLAPEQRMPGGSRDADRRTDIYQLGKMLYQMLTGLEPLLVDLSKVSAGLRHIIRKATQEHPQERYQTVGEFIDAVKLYQHAKDPSSNPVASFETAITQIKERLKYEEYREAEIRPILTALNLAQIREEHAQFLEMFDAIPETILRVCADQFGNDFQPVMEAYVSAVDDQVGGRSFSYAETVADKMTNVFAAPAASAKIKALALEALLLGAVRLSRFKAVDKFNELLPKVKDDDTAYEVAEMLRRRQGEYGRVYDDVPAIKLHPVIRALREELESGKSKGEI
jgi:eukaryotic-like serine/threonine-protein kinase